MKYKIELKNIKFSEFATRETHCFQATVYVNGDRSFIARNDGQGGCDMYDALPNGKNNETHKLVEEINAELKKEKIPCSWDKNETIENSIDIVIGNLMNDWLRDKDIKKSLKKICYIKNDEIYSLASKHKPTEQNLKMVMKTDWWKPEYIMLNSLPYEEAKKLFIENMD